MVIEDATTAGANDLEEINAELKATEQFTVAGWLGTCVCKIHGTASHGSQNLVNAEALEHFSIEELGREVFFFVVVLTRDHCEREIAALDETQAI